MFWKTPLTIQLGDVSHLKGDLVHQFGALRYFKMLDTPEVLQPLHDALRPDVWVIVDLFQPVILPPHRDAATKCALNFYIQPGGDGVTTFYESHNKSKRHYTMADAWPISSFMAKQDEVYLLDVSQIHGVAGLTSPRFFVQAEWLNRSFASVLGCLQEMLSEAQR